MVRRIAQDLTARLSVLARSRARLSQPRTQHADAVARRTAAPAAGDAGPLQPVRRRLRARRTLGGPASLRYRGAAEGARSPESIRQFAVRRRTRAGRHPPRRLDRRCRARCRRTRRLRALQRPARRAEADRAVADAASPFPRIGCDRRNAASTDRMAAAPGRHAQQPCPARRRFPAGRPDQRDRRFRLGQVEPGQPVSGRSGGREARPRHRVR